MSLFSLIAEGSAAAQGAAATAPGTAATQPQGAGGGGWASMVPFFLIIGAMIFLMFRTQKKQQQKRQQMLDKLVKGSRVLLAGGMFGTVYEVRDQSCLVDLADNVRVEVAKNGIADIVESAAAASDDKK